jgi:hypothetical protein
MIRKGGIICGATGGGSPFSVIEFAAGRRSSDLSPWEIGHNTTSQTTVTTQQVRRVATRYWRQGPIALCPGAGSILIGRACPYSQAPPLQRL